jgi:hypothetical protein
MSAQMVKLIDRGGNLIATAQVDDEGEHFGGTIDLQATPGPVRSLFNEFEEIVNGQMFSFLDEIQDKIDALSLRAVFVDGRTLGLKDLQVFPTAGDVSFKLVAVPGDVPAKRATHK